jgi:hypothetical protein
MGVTPLDTVVRIFLYLLAAEVFLRKFLFALPCVSSSVFMISMWHTFADALGLPIYLEMMRQEDDLILEEVKTMSLPLSTARKCACSMS